MTEIDRSTWWLDEVAHAGQEHLDEAYVAGYETKAGYDPRDDLDVLRSFGFGTDSTIVDPDAFVVEMDRIRRRGYAVNEGEQEAGMRCVSVAIPCPGQSLGFSLSAPTHRMTDAVLRGVVIELKRVAAALAADLLGAA